MQLNGYMAQGHMLPLSLYLGLAMRCASRICSASIVDVDLVFFWNLQQDRALDLVNAMELGMGVWLRT